MSLPTPNGEGGRRMSSIYCHIPGCKRTSRGERDAKGRPLCDPHKATNDQDELIHAAMMLTLAFPAKTGTKGPRR